MGATKSNHCVYDSHYHVVFLVKYRKALLSEPVATAIRETARNIEERYNLTIEKMGTDGDHIHLLSSGFPY